MSFFDGAESALIKLAKIRMKARFVFRAVNPGSGALFGIFGGGGLFVLPINPQQFEIARPTAGAVHLTEGGAYEDDFGMGLTRGHIRGTFGFKPRPQPGSGGLPLLGMDQLNLFQDLITSYYTSSREMKAQNDAHWEFYDLADLYFMKIRIDLFVMRRDARDPWLHWYEVRFTVLEDYFSAGSVIPRIPLDAIPGLGGPVGTVIGVAIGGIASVL